MNFFGYFGGSNRNERDSNELTSNERLFLGLLAEKGINLNSMKIDEVMKLADSISPPLKPGDIYITYDADSTKNFFKSKLYKNFEELKEKSSDSKLLIIYAFNHTHSRLHELIKDKVDSFIKNFPNSFFILLELLPSNSKLNPQSIFYYGKDIVKAQSKGIPIISYWKDGNNKESNEQLAKIIEDIQNQ